MCTNLFSFNSIYRHRLRSFSCVNTELYCVITRAVDVTMNVTVVKFDQAEQAEHVIKYIKEEPRVKIEEIDEEDPQVVMNDDEIEVKQELLETHVMPTDQVEQPGRESVLRFHNELGGSTGGMPRTYDEVGAFFSFRICTTPLNHELRKQPSNFRRW
ncbi:hypothetical protein Y032_0072g675 [Ancylostoma ceylanicum]|uniref:Uncharacterized protein n=2 Tax=Ancylostoma ceylanicum TaxID=53326 RepID=A0A016TXK4_9BILA|nr:hypothetical protein Y032_0072g675 [Ancylostoma ceylanicum]